MRFVRHIGIDHAFPFPMSYMQRYGNETRDQFLDGFMRLGEVDRQIDLDVDPGLARKVRSGSPGQLPTRGSHRSGRAAFPHPAPRISASLRHGKYCEPRAGAAGDNGSINDGSAPSPYLNGWTADSATCASSVRPAAENATGLAHCR